MGLCSSPFCTIMFSYLWTPVSAEHVVRGEAMESSPVLNIMAILLKTSKKWSLDQTGQMSGTSVLNKAVPAKLGCIVTIYYPNFTCREPRPAKAKQSDQVHKGRHSVVEQRLQSSSDYVARTLTIILPNISYIAFPFQFLFFTVSRPWQSQNVYFELHAMFR